MTSNYVIADRADALGGRLMVLLNGLRLAQKTNARFLMTWLTGPSRFFQIITPLEQIFSGDLVLPFDEESGAGCIISTDHPLVKNSSARVESLPVEEAEIYGFRDVFFRPKIASDRPYKVNARFANYCLAGETFDEARQELAATFAGLQKNPAIEAIIGQLTDALDQRGRLISLHVRRQDLLSHTHVQANRFESYCTLDSCKLLIEQQAGSCDHVLVSSDSNYLVDELKTAYPGKVITPSDVLNKDKMTPLQRALMDIVFLSRGQEVFGPLSAYGTTASIIGPARYRNLHPYLARHNLLQGDHTGAVRLFQQLSAGRLESHLEEVTLKPGQSARAMHLAWNAPVCAAGLSLAIRALAMRLCELAVPYSTGGEWQRYLFTVERQAEGLRSPLLPDIELLRSALTQPDPHALGTKGRLSLQDTDSALLQLSLRVVLADKISATGASKEALALYRESAVLAGRLQVTPRGLLLRQADLLDKDGNQAKALDVLRQAVTADPDFALSHFLLAMALRKAGSLEEALQSASKATELDPYAGQFWQFSGQLFGLLNQPDRQKECFRKALACDPENEAFEAALAKSLAA
ncbi:hypothetical protein ACTL6U_14520 [Rhodovibrionaceae bacterium A322]